MRIFGIKEKNALQKSEKHITDPHAENKEGDDQAFQGYGRGEASSPFPGNSPSFTPQNSQTEAFRGKR
jgi:hypothetical protein